MVILRAIGRMVFATVIMSIVSYVCVQLLQLQNTDQSFLATFPKFVMIVAVSGSIYLLLSRMLGLHEANPILRKIEQLLFAKARSD